jgi:hypothetical protein
MPIKSFFAIKPSFLCTAWAIMLLVLTIGCTEQNRNIPGEEKKPAHKPPLLKKPPSSFNDTLVIDQKSAVFYCPDSLQMKKIEAINEKNMMAQIRHDCHYQMAYARSSLKSDWPGVKVIDASGVRYLEFVKTDGTKTFVDLNEKNDICGLFLFDVKKEPILVDMPNVDTILGSYFRN